jgi:hypothetical protein
MPSAKLAPKWGCPIRPVLEMEVNTNTKIGKIGGSRQTIGILDEFRRFQVILVVRTLKMILQDGARYCSSLSTVSPLASCVGGESKNRVFVYIYI